MKETKKEISLKNTDQWSGFQTGRNKGKTRIGGKLVNRPAPSHLTGKRLCDWNEGYLKGLRQRRSDRYTTVLCIKDGNIECVGFSSGSHRSMIERAIKMGCEPNDEGDFIIDTGRGKRHVYGW